MNYPRVGSEARRIAHMERMEQLLQASPIVQAEIAKEEAKEEAAALVQRVALLDAHSAATAERNAVGAEVKALQHKIEALERAKREIGTALRAKNNEHQAALIRENQIRRELMTQGEEAIEIAISMLQGNLRQPGRQSVESFASISAALNSALELRRAHLSPQELQRSIDKLLAASGIELPRRNTFTRIDDDAELAQLFKAKPVYGFPDHQPA